MSSVIRGSDNFDTAGAMVVKAWVNFNGTGTVAIRAGYNVSSITDNGVGDYTANFTTNMVDANYTAIGVCVDNSAGSGTYGLRGSTTVKTIAACRFITAASSTATPTDLDTVYMSFNR